MKKRRGKKLKRAGVIISILIAFISLPIGIRYLAAIDPEMFESFRTMLALYSSSLGCAFRHRQNMALSQQLDARDAKSPTITVWQTLVQMTPQKKIPPSVGRLIGKEITISGFAVVLDRSSIDEVHEFFLTPVAGGCIHVPPPPPNYMIHVLTQSRLASSIPLDASKVVTVRGKLKLPQDGKDLQFYSFEIAAESVGSFSP